MKKVISDMICDWHDKGFSIDETVEQLKVPRDLVTAIIGEYEKHKRA